VVAARRCSRWVMLTRLCSNANTTCACIHHTTAVHWRHQGTGARDPLLLPTIYYFRLLYTGADPGLWKGVRSSLVWGLKCVLLWSPGTKPKKKEVYGLCPPQADDLILLTVPQWRTLEESKTIFCQLSVTDGSSIQWWDARGQFVQTKRTPLASATALQPHKFWQQLCAVASPNTTAEATVQSLLHNPCYYFLCFM